MAKMTPFKKAVAINGSYESNGETKKRYVNVGTLFQYEDGGFSLKIESLPVGGEWNGFISFFDLDEKKSGGSASGQSKTRTAAFEDDSEIPFVRMANDYEC